MSVTAASLRLALPAFSSAPSYPDDAISFWIGIAGLMLSGSAWGVSATAAEPATAGGAMSSVRDYGILLFVAHNLILEQQAGRTSARGGVPGLNTGAVSSKSVGPVSQGYDTSAGLELEAGHWNLTVYGTRFVRLANSLGTRVMTIGGGSPMWSGTIPQGPAWPGPPGGLFPWW